MMSKESRKNEKRSAFFGEAPTHQTVHEKIAAMKKKQEAAQLIGKKSKWILFDFIMAKLCMMKTQMASIWFV